MKKNKRVITLVACAIGLLSGLSTNSYAADAEVTLRRLDCGNNDAPSDIARFSDTFAYEGKKLLLTYSCYLIQHGDDYLIWDAGLPAAGEGRTAKISIEQQLSQLNLKPSDINYIGVSHYHFDHIGQLPVFKDSVLLIGLGDWNAVSAEKPAQGINAAPFKHWLEGNGKKEVIAVDKDLFGDGTVKVINTPGHTPGHHSLLVSLKNKGNVLLTGDLAHFRENYDSNGVPQFNTHRGDTLASFDRFKNIAKNLKATVIIQHDPRDIEKLPKFPKAAD